MKFKINYFELDLIFHITMEDEKNKNNIEKSENKETTKGLEEDKINEVKKDSKILKEEYDNKITEIKNKMLKLLDNITNMKNISPTLPQKFKNSIEAFINKIDEEKLLIEKFSEEKVLSMKLELNINKFEEMVLLHSTIQESINKEFKSYEEMLTQKGLFQLNHPIQNFVQRNPHIIKDSNIYDKLKNKVDVGEFFDKIQDLEIKKYIISDIIVHTININLPNQVNELKYLLKRNNKLKNLSIYHFEEKDFKNLFSESTNNIIENVHLTNCKINELCLSDIFPNISNLYSQKITFTQNSLEKFHNLKILSLNNCNLIDFLLSKIMEALVPIKDILTILSFRHNRITSFSSEILFSNIEELDLGYNKISRFDIKSVLKFPKLKLLDLTYNNYASLTNELEQFYKYFSKGKLCLIFQNIYIMRPNNREQYYNYFNQNLQLLNYPIRTINFECFFDKTNYEKLKQINFSNFQHSITSINLSFCNLTDDKIFELLEGNLCLFNLRELSLSSNEITNKFFTEYIKRKIYNLLPLLSKINLSSNNINFDKVEEFNELKDFLLETQSLKELFLHSSSIENIMNDYLKKELKFFYDSRKSKNVKLSLKPLEQEIKNLIELLKNNSNVIIHIKDPLKKEYSSKLKKHFIWFYRNFYLDDK